VGSQKKSARNDKHWRNHLNINAVKKKVFFFAIEYQKGFLFLLYRIFFKK